MDRGRTPENVSVIVALAHHWQLALAAAAAGLALGVTVVAVSCLAASVRLRLTASPSERARLLRRELARLRRLGDAAAVSEEHGLSGGGELREEAELRALLLWRPWSGSGRR